MNLNARDIEQVRLSLLRYALDRRGFSLGLATSYLRSEGFARIEQEQVEIEIEYLCDAGKGFLQELPKPISPENRRWAITASGRDFLAQQ